MPLSQFWFSNAWFPYAFARDLLEASTGVAIENVDLLRIGGERQNLTLADNLDSAEANGQVGIATARRTVQQRVGSKMLNHLYRK